MSSQTTVNTGSTPRVTQLSGKQEIYKSESLFTKALRRLRQDKLTIFAASVLLVLVLAAVFAPVIAQALNVDHIKTNPRERLLAPFTNQHILGTDHLGRDMFARLLFAGQISLSIGFASASVTLIIGLTLGMMTGYFGGLIDDITNWVITTLDSLPGLYLLIAVSALLRPSPEALVLVIAVTGWTGATRLVRGQTLSIRNLDYVLAARALGAPAWRIMFVHILPNLISILVISLTIGIGGVILAESALSFLSLGVQPPTPTWGNMLDDSRDFFRTTPHLLILPGLVIFVTVLCLYIIGDGIRDAFDPTSMK